MSKINNKTLEEIMNWNNERHYIIKSKSYANCSYTMDEWIKFLSYVKPEEKELLKEIEKKPLYDLLQDEIDFYRNLRYQIQMGKSFLKYKNHDCTPDEHDKVYQYMDNSLEEFMVSRLSEEELKAANILIGGLYKKPDEELELYINDLQERYAELSLVDAYVLHHAREVRYNKLTEETTEKILREKEERERSLVRSLRRDYGI